MLRLHVLMVAGLGVLVGFLGFGAGPASAELQYPFVRQIPGSVSELENVAVDGLTGGTLISETADEIGGLRGAVRVYSASGTLETTWDGSVTPAGRFNRVPDVAVDDATGDAYVVASEEHVVDVLDSTGAYVSQLTGAGVPGGLLEPFAVAVDQVSGNVYVYDRGNQVIDVFSSTGLLLSQITSAGGHAFEDVRSMAFDGATGHLLVADSEKRVVYELEASGGLVGTWEGLNTPQGSFGNVELWVAANDATGDVYVAQSDGNVVDQFTSAEVYIGQIAGTPQAGFEALAGVAVAQSNGDVYVADKGPDVVDVFTGSPVVVPDVTTSAASGVLPTGATLNGTVNPDGIQVSDCHFEYGTDTSYGQSAPCVPAAGAIPADSSEHAVNATLTGLAAGTTYHFRLVAANANGASTGSDATFATPPPPLVEGAAAQDVTGNSVDLTARVNPNGYDTTYRFEWGTSTAYGTSIPVPDADAGAGTSGVPVGVHVSGLNADTTYHWRVVAQSANGTTTTGDHTFIYSQSGTGLPDNRAYEMVSPPRKNAAVLGTGYDILQPDVAEGGSRVTGSSIQCFEGAVGCNAIRKGTGDPYLFSRTPGGWVTTPLAPSAAGLFVDQPSNQPESVSVNAGTALFSVGTPTAGEDDWWARGSDGSFVDIGPLTPPVDGPQGPVALYAVSTVDLSRVAWATDSTSGGSYWPFDSSLGNFSAYEYVGGGNSAPVLVGVSGGLGSTDLISDCGTELGGVNNEHIGAMSADGRTVFFTASACGSGSGVNAGVPVPADEVFARIDESRSVLISGRSPVDCTGMCQGSEARQASFVGASTDGSRVFFTSAQQLTNDASEGDSKSTSYCSETGGSGCNLYQYDSSGLGGRSLVAASAGDSSGGGPRVQGVLGFSTDGSHAYFVAKGVLSTAANSQGATASDGAENLYVFERDARYPEGHVAFIGTLSGSEPAQWDRRIGSKVDVTPDGRFLVFTSRAALTADDTSASGAAQVFRYDAVSGVLTRISIGDRGFNDNGNTQESSPCYGFCSEDASIAEPDSNVAGPVRLDPTMSHDGSFVFFESPVALAPGALDDVRIATYGGVPTYAQNVYEYHDGRVYLISDGKDTANVAGTEQGDESDVRLIGSDATGANVFFATSDRLVPQDTDTEVDYYDARVCTTGDPCITAPSVPAGCLGEGCHGTPPPAPLTAGVGSAAFAGPGNLPAPAATAKKAAVKRKHVKHKARKHPKHRRAKGRKAGHTTRGRRGGRS